MPAYCLACHYELTGLSEPRCPECGRLFDPADPATFTRDLTRAALRRLLKRVGCAMGVLVLALALVMGWFYWGWRTEQEILSSISVPWAQCSLLPAQWNKWLTARGIPIFNRVSAMIFYLLEPNTEEHLRQLAHLQHLESLEIRGNYTVAGVEHLTSFPALKDLTLTATKNVSDDFVLPLMQMQRLENLRLRCLPFTDAGYRELASLQNLALLEISSATLSQAALDELKRLPRLRTLVLSNCTMTPEAIASIGAWDHLETLAMQGRVNYCSVLPALTHMKSLRKLYLESIFQCVNEVGALADARPGVEVWLNGNRFKRPSAPGGR